MAKKRKKSLSAQRKKIARLERELRAARKEIRETRQVKKKKKKVRKVPTKRKRKLPERGRDVTQKPKLAIARDYDSGFKPFLERIDKRRSGVKMRAYAIVRVTLLDYADSPTRDLAIFLGTKTRKELESFTNKQLMARAPDRWGTLGSDSQVLFLAALRGGARASTQKRPDRTRQRIAKRNKKAKASIKAANIRRRQQGRRFHP